MSSHNLEGTHLAYVDCLNEWVEKFILPDRPSLSIRKDKSIQDQSKFSSTLKIKEPDICDHPVIPDLIARDTSAKFYGNKKNFYLIGEGKTASDWNTDKKRKFEQMDVYFFHLQKKAERDDYETLILYALPEFLLNEARMLLTKSKKRTQANLVNFEVISELGLTE